jgi:hypothetical protein
MEATRLARDEIVHALDRLLAYSELAPGRDTGAADLGLRGEWLKRLSELMIVADVAERTGPPEVLGRVAQVRARVDSMPLAIGEPVALSEVLPAAQMLLHHGPRARGSRAVEARALLLDDGFQQLYRDPATELSYRRLLARTRGVVSYYWADIAGRLLCATCVAPAALRRNDVYDFTHEIFYLTEFGAQPLPTAIDDRIVRHVLDVQESATVDSRDDDLLIELMIARTCSGMFDLTKRAVDALSRLALNAQRRWFTVPGHSAILAGSLDGENRRHYECNAQFHPFVVWNLLLALLHERGVLD